MAHWNTTLKDPNQGIRVGHWCDVFGNMLISDIKTEMIRDEVRSLKYSRIINLTFFRRLKKSCLYQKSCVLVQNNLNFVESITISSKFSHDEKC